MPTTSFTHSVVLGSTQVPLTLMADLTAPMFVERITKPSLRSWPAATVPRFQTMLLPLAAPPSLAETSVVPAGKAAVIMLLGATASLVFLTTTLKLMSRPMYMRPSPVVQVTVSAGLRTMVEAEAGAVVMSPLMAVAGEAKVPALSALTTTVRSAL